MPKTMTKTSGAGARTGAVAERKLLLGMVPGDQEPGGRPSCRVLLARLAEFGLSLPSGRVQAARRRETVRNDANQ